MTRTLRIWLICTDVVAIALIVAILWLALLAFTGVRS